MANGVEFAAEHGKLNLLSEKQPRWIVSDHPRPAGRLRGISSPPSSLATLPTIKEQAWKLKNVVDLDIGQTFEFHLEIVVQINLMLSKYQLPLLLPDTVKRYHEDVGNIKQSSGWFPWKKLAVSTISSKDHDVGVFQTSLVRSIDAAHVNVYVAGNTLTTKVPIVIHECAEFIKRNVNVMGIFRLSSMLRQIMAPIGTSILTSSFEGCNPFDVADCFKKYLRTLPEPLLTTCLSPYMVQAIKLPNEQDQKQLLQHLCLLLPPSHIVVLEYTLTLLKQVSQASSFNQMDVTNLSKIFAPTLMWTKVASATTAVSDLDDFAKLAEYLITNAQRFMLACTPVHAFFRKSDVPQSGSKRMSLATSNVSLLRKVRP